RQAHLSAVRVFCQHLRHLGAMHDDPTDVITRPRSYKREPVTLSAVEIITLLYHIPNARDRCMVALMLGCGLRAMDVAGLDVGDVDFVRKRLLIDSKGGKQRAVPIPVATLECLTDYLMERRPPQTASGHAYGPVI